MFRHVVRPALALSLLLLTTAIALAEPLPLPRFPDGNQIKNGQFNNGLNHWTLTKTSSGDKVRCNNFGDGDACALQLKNGAATPKTVLKQVYKPAATSGTMYIVMYANLMARNISGSSCIDMTLKLVFKGNAAPLVGTETLCGTGSESGWTSMQFGALTSFQENKLKKAVIKVKHSGKGTWAIDAVELAAEDK